MGRPAKPSDTSYAEEAVAALLALEQERLPLLRALQALEEKRMRILRMENSTRRAEDPVASRLRRTKLMLGSSR